MGFIRTPPEPAAQDVSPGTLLIRECPLAADSWPRELRAWEGRPRARKAPSTRPVECLGLSTNDDKQRGSRLERVWAGLALAKDPRKG